MNICPFCKKDLVKKQERFFITYSCPINHYTETHTGESNDARCIEYRYKFMPDYLLTVTNYETYDNRLYCIKLLGECVDKRGKTLYPVKETIMVQAFDIGDNYERLRQKIETVITFE